MPESAETFENPLENYEPYECQGRLESALVEYRVSREPARLARRSFSSRKIVEPAGNDLPSIAKSSASRNEESRPFSKNRIHPWSHGTPSMTVASSR